ncbi:MAG: DUF6701 domain-containing protein [Betaproteobacteria bacterium]
MDKNSRLGAQTCGPVMMAGLVLVALALLPQLAHALSQTRSPGACATGGGAGNAWNNPGNALSSNNADATVSVDGSTSEALECANYSFSIPAGATITGIEVNVERSSSSTNNGGSRDASLLLLGGTLAGSNLATATIYTTGDVVETHGNPTETWGNAWTVAQINAAAFGAALRVTKPGGGGPAHTVSVDHIQITVYYSNPPPAPVLVVPADGASVAVPAFDWGDVIDPDGDAVTYEMQADNDGCAFASPEVDASALAVSTFTPGGLAEGTYCWRARAVDEFGLAGPWSATRNVTINLPASQTRSPGACVSGGGAGDNWNNPDRAVSSNNSDATVSVDGDTSEALECTNYGFSIPAGSVILGITVNVERSSNRTQNGGSRDASLLLLGGSVTGSDLATTTTYTTSDVVEGHGGAAETWGNTWTSGQINAAAFGAALRVTKPDGGGPPHTVSVDHMPIVVYYSQPPPAPTLVSPAAGASVTTATPVFDWTDVIDPDGDAVTYEMQADNNGCAFASPEINVTGLVVSTYTPPGALANGTYCWRARAVDQFGVIGPWSTTFSFSMILSAFDAVEITAAANTPIRTKLSGAGFTLDVLALDSAGDILAGYLGTVTVEIVNAATGGGVCAAMTSLQNLGSVAFNAGNVGRRTINTFNYANAVPNARIRITDATAGITGCSFDNFAIRPNTFGNFSVTDDDWQTAGTTRALTTLTFAGGGVLHKAGRPFTVRATAFNAAGVPAVTTAYAGAPAATVTACTGAACTPAFGMLTLGGGFTAGQLNTGTANYSEVGAFRLQLIDSTFAAVDASDSTALEREIRSAPLDVGRFVPDHFAVAFNTPAFMTACGGGGFSYVGEPFNYTAQPVITVTARNFAGNTTSLYAGGWWRISNSSLTPGTQAARYSAASGTLDVSGLPVVAGDPVVAATGSGAGTLIFSSGDGLAFARSTPVAPFDAEISLAINVVDADGVAYPTNPARFGQAAAGNGMVFSPDKEMRFGRLRLIGASGSQLRPLSVPFEVQYWIGTFFATNTADMCTTVASSNIGLDNYLGNLNGGDTAVMAVSALSGGRGTITLGAPGAGNSGSVDLAINLGAGANAAACPAFTPATATPAELAWLRGQWCGAAYDDDPAARVRFGIRSGAGERIYMRENY